MEFETRGQYLEELCRLAENAAGGHDPEGLSEEEFFDASARAFAAGLFLPLQYLVEILSCTPFERHCVLMALAYELGSPSQAACAALNGSETKAGLTPMLLGQTWRKGMDREVLCRAFREDGLLMGVLLRQAGADAPFAGQVLCLRPRIRSFLLGELRPSGETARVVGECFGDEELPVLDACQPDAVGLLKKETEAAEFFGPEGSGRRFSVRTACRKLGLRGLFVYLKEAADLGWTPEETVEAVRFECLLFQASPVLIVPRQWGERERELWLGGITKPLAEAARPVFVVSPGKNSQEIYGPLIKVQHFEVRQMSLGEARQVWRQEAEGLSFEPGAEPEDMANLFHFTRGQIKEALENAALDGRRQTGPEKQGDGAADRISRESLRRGCYSLFEKQLVEKAVRIPCTYGWEDLVLPKAQKDKLRAAAGQVRFKHQVYENWGFQQKMPYGQGVSMIFAGPPGTGKTMAAQVFAGELGLELYKVELSAVVSKFVGETEKNLNEIFRQAEKSRVVLLFDEADVLFAKRTEVKEANDKYSNMEAAFLLQKMEAYDGVTVLATNLIQNFDEAFKRRVKFVVDFPFPGREERRLLWEKALPKGAPARELDYDFLAQAFELSGSNIRNIVLHAAFLAAERGGELGMEEILLAVRNEFSKSGKTLTREDLGEYRMMLPEVR